MNKEESLQKLREIQDLLLRDRESFKACFGLLFWQLQQASSQFSYQEIVEQSASFTLDNDEDEGYGILLGIYFQIWDSSKDFNAASRFIADTLKMSADELIQCKILFEKNIG